MKIGLIAIALLLAVSCGIQSGYQSTSDRPDNLQGQILVWAQNPRGSREAQSSRYQAVITDIIDSFEELHPDTQVFVKFVPADRIVERFEAELNLGAGPDLLLMEGRSEIPRFIRSGLLRVLEDSEIDSSQFNSEALKQVRYQGQFYGFPLYLLTQVLCYNRDKVSELPNTLSELLEQARQGHSVGVESGFADTFWGAGVYGGQLFDESGRFILAQGGGWARWMTWLKDAQNEPNFILNDDSGALQAAFAEGRLAYLTCKSHWISNLQEQLGDNRLGVTLLPGEANQPATPVLRVALLLFNQYSSRNQHQLAIELAQFMTNVQQQKYAQTAVSLTPSNRHVSIDTRLFPLQSTFLAQARTSIGLALDDVDDLVRDRELSNSVYVQVISGQLDPDEAATQLEESINQSLDSN